MTKKDLTRFQAVCLLTICFVANKTQRLPSLISANVGRHGWIVNLVLGGIELLMLCLFLFASKFSGGRTCYKLCENAGGKWFAKFIVFFFAIYFMLNALLPYEAVHEVFSNVLFDHLSWEFYSLFIVFAIAFFASKGLVTIGRIGELFFVLILSSLLLLIILGGFTTSFVRILPIFDIDWSKIFQTCYGFSLWFGDFIIMYLFMGRIKDDGKKKDWIFVVSLAVSVVLMSFAYVIFYGLYGRLSSEQTNAISAISQFSLLSLDIGRVDWFLVLFFEISTFISSGVYVFGASKFFSEVFETKTHNLFAVTLPLVIYFLDIFIFKSIGQGVGSLAFVVKYFYPIVILGFPVILFFASLVSRKKDKQNLKMNKIEKFAVLFEKNKAKKVKNSKSIFQQNKTILKNLMFSNQAIRKREKRKCTK